MQGAARKISEAKTVGIVWVLLAAGLDILRILYDMYRMSCLFCDIVAGKKSSRIVYEDDQALAFEDVRPQAPTHVLIVPKRHIVDLKNAVAEDAGIIGYLQLIAARIARDRGIEDGYRTVFNVGEKSGQSVFHLHLHLLGGRVLRWPPG